MPTALPQTGHLVAQWSADSLTPQSDNTNVTATWTDSINGYGATWSTTGQSGRPSAAPKYRTNTLGTKPSVRFFGTGNGSSMLMGRPAAVVNALNAQTATCFVVFKTVTPSNNGGCLLDLGIDGSGNFMLADGANVGSFNDSYMKVPFSDQTSFSTLAITSGSYTNGTGTFVLERWFINGGCVGHASSAASGPGATVSLCIGANANNGAFINCEADIYEILFWDSRLTPTEILQVQMWACDKYSQAYPWSSKDNLVIFDGDSITMGLGGNSPADSYPYQAAQTLGLTFGQWTNLGIGGDTVTDMATRAPNGIDDVYALIGKPIRLAAFEWYNQRAAAPTPQNASLSYLSGRRTSNVFVCFGTSTDNSDAAPDTNRVNYDSYFDANHSSGTMDAYVPLHLDPNIGVEGSFLSFPGNWADIVHLSPAGYIILAALMAAGVKALPVPQRARTGRAFRQRNTGVN